MDPNVIRKTWQHYLRRILCVYEREIERESEGVMALRNNCRMLCSFMNPCCCILVFPFTFFVKISDQCRYIYCGYVSHVTMWVKSDLFLIGNSRIGNMFDTAEPIFQPFANNKINTDNEVCQNQHLRYRRMAHPWSLDVCLLLLPSLQLFLICAS